MSPLSRRVRFGRPVPPPDLKQLVNAIREDVSARLRRSCIDLPDEEFEQLVTDVANTKVCWKLEESGEGSSVPRALRRSAWVHWWAHLRAHVRATHSVAHPR